MSIFMIWSVWRLSRTWISWWVLVHLLPQWLKKEAVVWDQCHCRHWCQANRITSLCVCILMYIFAICWCVFVPIEGSTVCVRVAFALPQSDEQLHIPP